MLHLLSDENGLVHQVSNPLAHFPNCLLDFIELTSTLNLTTLIKKVIFPRPHRIECNVIGKIGAMITLFVSLVENFLLIELSLGLPLRPTDLSEFLINHMPWTFLPLHKPKT